MIINGMLSQRLKMTEIKGHPSTIAEDYNRDTSAISDSSVR